MSVDNLTIIIPTILGNRASYLIELLDSINTFARRSELKEVVIFVNSDKKVEKTWDGFDIPIRVEYAKEPRLEFCDSVNTAVSFSTTPLTLIIGDDDLLVQKLPKTGALDVKLLFLSFYKNRHRENMACVSKDKEGFDEISADELVAAKFGGNLSSAIGGVIFHTDSYNKIGGLQSMKVSSEPWVDDILWFKLSNSIDKGRILISNARYWSYFLNTQDWVGSRAMTIAELVTVSVAVEAELSCAGIATNQIVRGRNVFLLGWGLRAFRKRGKLVAWLKLLMLGLCLDAKKIRYFRAFVVFSVTGRFR